MKKDMFVKLGILFLLCCDFAPSTWAKNTILPEIRVKNALEFLQALGSDRIIILPEGASFNLTQALKDEQIRSISGIQDESQDIDKSNLPKESMKFITSVFDGEELELFNMQNLTIVGEGKDRPEIVIEPRYAYIFRFSNCQNITLRHLEIGHTPEGYCMGGVLCLEDCNHIIVNDCDLYGCGTEGITSNRSTNLQCSNSIIRDCSYSIMTLTDSRSLHFKNCLFYRNKEFSLVNINSTCQDVCFSYCNFRDNDGTLFLLESPIQMESCIILHPEESLGTVEQIRDKKCQWNPQDNLYQPKRSESISPADNPNVKYLREHAWTNGYECVRALNFDELHIHVSGKYNQSNYIVMWGGNLHEGGTILPLKFNEEKIWVDNQEIYQWFPKGSILEVDRENGLVFIRDKKTHKLYDVLKKTTNLDGLLKMVKANFLQYLCAGNYHDEAGKTYYFSATEPIAKGISAQSDTFELGMAFGSPQPILIFKDASYAVDKTPKGLLLTPVRQNEQNDMFEHVPNSVSIKLTRTLSPDECAYPFVSDRYLTSQELRVYVGAFYASIDRDMRINYHYAAEIISTMRNEIFARHGYKFKTAKWIKYFQSKAWYKPLYDQVDDKLTPIEKANIELIKDLEKEVKTYPLQ